MVVTSESSFLPKRNTTDLPVLTGMLRSKEVTLLPQSLDWKRGMARDANIANEACDQEREGGN